MTAKANKHDTSWIDRERYPFDSNYINFSEGRIHYVDEGPGNGGQGTLLMLHGNPTWSFLYRHLIRGLSDEYRCIAIDHLGFGLSERPSPSAFSYRPEDHAAVIEKFIEALGLTNITLVVHDWGGPIGFSYALSHPENVCGFVIMNTWFWPTNDRMKQRLFSRRFDSPLGRWFCERHNGFARYMMPLLYADRSQFTPSIHRHYIEPLSTPSERRGSWVFPREITGQTEWLASLWEHRARITEHPALIVWGKEDVGFEPETLRIWEGLFPNALVHEADGVGHYVQEELGPDLVPLVREYLGDLSSECGNAHTP